MLFYFYYLLAVCTPLGFVRLFGVVGQVLVKPHLLRDVNDEYHSFNMEEAALKRKLKQKLSGNYNGKQRSADRILSNVTKSFSKRISQSTSA